MTRGPGRHSERNFRAAEQHYNAAEWPTDAERGSVPLCRHQILNWFYGLNRSEDSKPTGSLGPASQKQLVWTSTKLANRRTGVLDWLAYCRRLCCSSRQSGRCTDVSVGQSSGNCHVPDQWPTSLPWNESEAVRASAVTTRETSWFLQSWNSRGDKCTWDGVIKGVVYRESARCMFADQRVNAPCVDRTATLTGIIIIIIIIIDKISLWS